MKILLIQQKMIGDVLLSTILLELLKQQHPTAEIHYLINTNTKAVVEGNPHVDQIIEYLPQYDESKVALYSFLKSIRKTKYDLVVDAYGKLTSNLITYFSKAEKRISFYKSYTQFLYTQTVKHNPKVLTNAGNALEDRLRLLVPEHKIVSHITTPKIFLNTEELQQAKLFLTNAGIDLGKPLLMVSILGSDSTKSLPHDYMAQVLNHITKNLSEVQLLCNYIPHQKATAQQIVLKTSAATQKHIAFEVFGQSLRQFLGILSYCDALVGNEGGAVNMAKALGIPTFTIFSPWIKKEVWNMFDDDHKHVSVHLNDYKPELYNNIAAYKELKSNAAELYQEFRPAFFESKLKLFLERLQELDK